MSAAMLHNTRDGEGEAMARADYMIAFAAGAALGMAVREAAKKHNMTLSEFMRAWMLGTVPLKLSPDVQDKAREEARELAARAIPGGGRPRKPRAITPV